MEARTYHFLDRLIGGIDRTIKTLTVPPKASPAPVSHGSDAPLTPAERAESARLMRVNHAGEVAAQALYQGQALTARSETIRTALQQSADEEHAHLAWCEERIRELGGTVSFLNPVWYFGSFAIGALAGVFGDSVSLGFVAETEAQVESHLTGHLGRMSVHDLKSRAILEQMKQDEIRHGAKAIGLGGRPLPGPVAAAMRATSKLMTRGSYWL
jgi:ubiquinone biosynthesis monooxygenase Coq7